MPVKKVIPKATDHLSDGTSPKLVKIESAKGNRTIVNNNDLPLVFIPLIR